MQGTFPPKPDGRGSSFPDGVIANDSSNGEFAIEAKYIGDWAESLYNPELRRSFPHNAVQETIAKAVKYAEKYPEGVEWVTNSLGFVRTYAKLFSEAGVKDFHFTIIPAVRR